MATIEATVPNDYHLETLAIELDGAGHKLRSVQGGIAKIDTDDETAARAIVSAHAGESLTHAKRKLIRQRDRDTAATIAGGFSYGGKTLSLSIPAQMKLLGAFVARDSLSYPLVWNTIDDGDTITIADATEMAALHAAAMVALRTALDAGTTAKDQIRAATTKAELP